MSLFLLCLGGYLQAQPADFAAVEKWRLSFNYSAQQTVKTDEAQWTYTVTAVADFVLDDRRETDDQWYGHPNTTVTVRLTGSTSVGCPVTQTVEYTGPAQRQEEPDATLYAGEDGFFLQMGNGWVESTVTTEWDCPGMPPSVIETEPRMFTSEWTDPIPYPTDGLTLSGVLKRSEYISPIIPMVSANEPVDVTMSYTLTPEFDDYALEVRIDNYAKWRPLGHVAQPDKPGNHLTAKGTVLPKGDAAPPRVRGIRFELLDVSREPGICLNWPLGAKDREPDLRLAADPACPGTLGDEDQRLEVTEPLIDELQRPYALARIDSYDFGGRATLRVTAELLDGRELVGELIGEGGKAAQDLIRLPKMAGPDWIAAAWKQDKGVTALADADDSEKVDGQIYDGDGYTLYEEYRGWVVAGQRIEGDPQRKDFFVLNLIGADARKGIDLFERVSQLRVHSKLRRSEMSEKTRLMNGNHRDAPRRVKQHGVWVKAFDSVKTLGVPGAATPMTKAGVSGRPGITIGIGILARDNPESDFNKPYNLQRFASYFAYDRAIAHELLHSVGVEHHGSGDYTLIVGYVSPRHPENKVGRPYYASSSDTPLGVFDEAGHDLATRDYTNYVKLRQWVDSIQGAEMLEAGRQYIARNGAGWLGINTPEQYANDMIERLLVGGFMHLGGVLGVEHGEHSGHQDCLMRYYFASFYQATGKKDTYYLVTPGTEPIGFQLCRVKTGTGVNAPSHKPQSRYGDAGPHGGDCFSQITPNDAIPPRKVK